jgi:phosphotransferase system IIB component
MFFIFGWNKPEIVAYGPVYQHTCPNCRNSEFWQLQKISYYFTLFFIPIFPHSSKYWYYCPVCNRGQELNGDTAKQYQIIAEANTSFLNKNITDEERIVRIENANAAINLIEQKKQVKYLKESEDYQAVVGAKSDNELYGILNNQSDQYSQAFLIAVEQEMKNRNLSPNI